MKNERRSEAGPSAQPTARTARGSRRKFPPSLSYCSDYDGWCRYAVTGANKVDLAGWKLEITNDPSCSSWGETTPPLGRVWTVEFELDPDLWRCGSSWNFRGIGTKGAAWVAMVDWGERVVAFISPEGDRTPLGGA